MFLSLKSAIIINMYHPRIKDLKILIYTAEIVYEVHILSDVYFELASHKAK